MADLGQAVRFVRVVRTPSSERYHLIGPDGERLGLLDLHYAGVQGGDYVHGTLVFLEELEEEEEHELVELVNVEIVDGHAPELLREDFTLEVIQGKLISAYTDSEDYGAEETEPFGPEEF